MFLNQEENLNDFRINPLEVFPDNIKVYDLMQETVDATYESLPRQCFHDLSDQNLQETISRIAFHLRKSNGKDTYNFFSKKQIENNPTETWEFYCCTIQTSNPGNASQLVMFSYDVKLLGPIHHKLSKVLENDKYFLDQFEKAAALTKKEKEIIVLLTKGKNSKQISNITFTSIHTISTHRRNINKKLGITNLAQLAFFAEMFQIENR